MSRRGGFAATFNGVRYLIFVLGALILVGTKSSTESDVRAFAWLCVVIGFPVPLLVLSFRFVEWILRLFGIGKRKPQAAPVQQMKVTVEWDDEPATDKQLGFIRHLGGNPSDGLTKSSASKMIDELLAKKRART